MDACDAVWVLLALALVGAVLVASPAGATFPGRNGPIAFRQFDPATEAMALLRARPDGTHVRTLTDLPGGFSDWRPDGRRVATELFDDQGNVQILTLTATGRDVRQITSGTGIHEVPSWSPNGRRIVFDFSPEVDPSVPDFHTRLWTMRSDGSDARPLPMREPGFDVEPKYSPNGRWIACSRLRRVGDEELAALFLVGAQGGKARQLTRFAAPPSYVEHPTWSPDSRWILFNLSPDGTIQAIRADGRGRHTIRAATEGFGGHKPWFSPDGSRILFMCENQGLLPEPPADYNEDICVMRADGSRVVNLTNTPTAFENFPSWGPAARDDR